MRSILYLVILSFFVSCSTKKIQAQNQDLNTEIWIVADRTIECIGEGVFQCIVYRVKGQDKWQMIFEGVEGFEYVEGNHYKIKIRKETIQNPPQDASSIKYILVELLEERPANPIEGVINDTWGVVELNGESIYPGKQEMTIELNSRQNSVHAYAGCNSIGGRLEILDGDSRSVRLTGLFATEKFCEDKMKLEKMYQTALRKMNRLEFEQAELRAFSGDKLLFVARRID
jgi:heat shock protein HslJ